MEHQDKQFLEYVVKALVDNPDDVEVDRKVDEMGVLITLSVHPDDMGKIIGRSGNTAKAIRTLLRVVGMKNNARVNLKINEPDRGDVARQGDGYDQSPEDDSSDAEDDGMVDDGTEDDTDTDVDSIIDDLKNE